MSPARSSIAFLSLAAIVLTPAGNAAAQVIRREYAIKAGVIVMLGKCVTWPLHASPTEASPLTIGILGQDPFIENGVNQLDRAVQEARLKGSHIAIKRFDEAEDYEPCHILFVSSLPARESAALAVEDRMKAALEATRGAHVLIVGEAEGLALRGAAANLMFDRGTNLIRLEINPDMAARSGLKFTPDLLRLKLVQVVRDLQKSR
jgi:hypothetical protein